MWMVYHNLTLQLTMHKQSSTGMSQGLISLTIFVLTWLRIKTLYCIVLYTEYRHATQCNNGGKIWNFIFSVMLKFKRWPQMTLKLGQGHSHQDVWHICIGHSFKLGMEEIGQPVHAVHWLLNLGLSDHHRNPKVKGVTNLRKEAGILRRQNEMHPSCAIAVVRNGKRHIAIVTL